MLRAKGFWEVYLDSQAKCKNGKKMGNWLTGSIRSVESTIISCIWVFWIVNVKISLTRMEVKSTCHNKWRNPPTHSSSKIKWIMVFVEFLDYDFSNACIIYGNVGDLEGISLPSWYSYILRGSNSIYNIVFLGITYAHWIDKNWNSCFICFFVIVAYA